MEAESINTTPHPHQAKLDALESLQSFLVEALTLLAGFELDINLSDYDLDNPQDVGRAQSDQAHKAQLLDGMASKVLAQSSTFKLLKYSIDALHKDYLVNYTLASPKPHGYPRDLYDHTATKQFMEDEGVDLELIFEIELHFDQLSLQLKSRQDRISSLYHQLREKQKSNALVLIQRPSGMSCINTAQQESFPDIGEKRVPMPKSRMISTAPALPAPAHTPAALPPGLQ